MKKTRINVLTTVNADKIKIARSEIEGEKYVAIKNVLWMADNSVLNGGLYSAAENEKGYASMDGRVMPFGHPMVNGQYVAISNLDSANVAVALGKHYGGVHAQNVRKERSSYFADVMINERVASSHDDGKLLLEWAANAESYNSGKGEKPGNIHMSTGLMTNRIQANGEVNGEKYTWSANDQQYDHLAILFHERGAGGDSVSIAVNCESVINSELIINDDEALKDSYGDKLSLLSAAVSERFGSPDAYAYVEDFDDEGLVFTTPQGQYRISYHMEDGNPILTGDQKEVTRKTEYIVKNSGWLERLKHMLQFNSKITEQPVQVNSSKEPQDMNPEEVKAALDALKLEMNSAFTESLASLKADHAKEIGAINTKLTANADAEMADKRAVVAKVHGEVVANGLSGEALDAMHAACHKTAPLIGGMSANSEEDEFKDYSLNSFSEDK
jgi:hypothetical protein